MIYSVTNIIFFGELGEKQSPNTKPLPTEENIVFISVFLVHYDKNTCTDVWNMPVRRWLLKVRYVRSPHYFFFIILFSRTFGCYFETCHECSIRILTYKESTIVVAPRTMSRNLSTWNGVIKYYEMWCLNFDCGDYKTALLSSTMLLCVFVDSWIFKSTVSDPCCIALIGRISTE